MSEAVAGRGGSQHLPSEQSREELTVWVKHRGNKLDDRGFVWVVLRELKGELEGAWRRAHSAVNICSRTSTEPRDFHNWRLRASPPSHGVSSGPKMTAFHSMMFSGFGEPFTPCGGSDCRRLKSRISRCRSHTQIQHAGKNQRRSNSRQVQPPYKRLRLDPQGSSVASKRRDGGKISARQKAAWNWTPGLGQVLDTPQQQAEVGI